MLFLLTTTSLALSFALHISSWLSYPMANWQWLLYYYYERPRLKLDPTLSENFTSKANLAFFCLQHHGSLAVTTITTWADSYNPFRTNKLATLLQFSYRMDISCLHNSVCQEIIAPSEICSVHFITEYTSSIHLWL